MLKDQLLYVENEIQKACDRSARNRNDVTLIAVSKTKPVETLQEAYNLGVRVFGENKVQELVDKYEVLPNDIKWHMIGHLQRNKVKAVLPKTELIHSVDSCIQFRIFQLQKNHLQYSYHQFELQTLNFYTLPIVLQPPNAWVHTNTNLA